MAKKTGFEGARLESAPKWHSRYVGLSRIEMRLQNNYRPDFLTGDDPKRTIRLSIIVASLLMIQGCDPYVRTFDPNASHSSVYGTQPLTRTDDEKPVDLPKLIDPDVKAESDYIGLGDGGSTGPFSHMWDQIPPDSAYEARLSDAIKAFNAQAGEYRLNRRNSIQEYLIGKSTTLCSLYKKQMQQTMAEQNLLLGDTTTALSGLATVFSRLAVVRPLSGAATIFSGARSEFNADIFENLNIQVITAGIEKRRSEYYAAILKARACTIDEYPLEQAIKDAFYFHGSCSLYAGLEEASLAIKQAQSPGLDELTDSFKKLNSIVTTSRAAFGEHALGSASKAPAPGTTDGQSSASAATDASTTALYSVSPSTDHVSATCELPIPGAAKASVQSKKPTSIMTADGKSIKMSYADARDPVVAFEASNQHFEDTIVKLLCAYTAPARGNDTAAKCDAKNLPTSKDSVMIALTTARKKAAESLEKSDITPSEVQSKMNNYYMAVTKFESVDSTTPEYFVAKTNVEKAQIENAEIADHMQQIVSEFDNSPGVKDISAAILKIQNKNRPPSN